MTVVVWPSSSLGRPPIEVELKMPDCVVPLSWKLQSDVLSGMIHHPVQRNDHLHGKISRIWKRNGSFHNLTAPAQEVRGLPTE
jgi:hypothetical protein